MPKKSSVARKSRKVRRSAGGGGRPSLLSRLSLVDLHREFQRRQQRYHDLSAQRDSLVAELREVESELSQYTTVGRSAPRRSPAAHRPKVGRPKAGTAKKAGRPAAAKASATQASAAGRPGRAGRGEEGMTLHDALLKVLKGRVLAIPQIIEAVQKVGYKSQSANFRNIIAQTLIASPKVFRRVSRGKYTAR